MEWTGTPSNRRWRELFATVFSGQTAAGGVGPETIPAEAVQPAAAPPEKTAEPVKASAQAQPEKSANTTQASTENSTGATQEKSTTTPAESSGSNTASAQSDASSTTSSNQAVSVNATSSSASQAVQTTSTQAPAEARTLTVAQQIVDQMQGAIQAGKSSIHIQLYPKELGGIELHLISGAHGVSVSVYTEQAETGKMLENQLSQLRQSLSEAGVKLSNLDINQGQQMAYAQQGGAFSQHSQRGSAAYIRRLDQEDELALEKTKIPLGKSLSATGIDYRI